MRHAVLIKARDGRKSNWLIMRQNLLTIWSLESDGAIDSDEWMLLAIR